MLTTWATTHARQDACTPGCAPGHCQCSRSGRDSPDKNCVHARVLCSPPSVSGPPFPRSSRQALERYLHYYTRFTNHDQSLKLEMEQRDKMEGMVKDMERLGQNCWMDCQVAALSSVGIACLAKRAYAVDQPRSEWCCSPHSS